jgi:hypothetical protein
VQSLDSLVHGLLLVVCHEFGEMTVGNRQTCQDTIPMRATLRLKAAASERAAAALRQGLKPKVDNDSSAWSNHLERL